jgi:hypothetical protein
MSLIVDLLRKVEEERRNKESPKGSRTFLGLNVERPKRRFNYLHLGYIYWDILYCSIDRPFSFSCFKDGEKGKGT